MQNGRCRFNKMCSRGLNHAVCAIFSEWIPLTNDFNDSFRERECDIAMYCANHAKGSHSSFGRLKNFLFPPHFRRSVECENLELKKKAEVK